MIKAVIADFQPQQHESPSEYDCPLVNSLNYDQQVQRENPSAGVLDLASLKQKADQQMQVELQDSVVVQSIEPMVEVTPHVAKMVNTCTFRLLPSDEWQGSIVGC